ncbi:MAG TPA: methyltransferase domain-containing protein [Tepidisphaeraceae bacterium]|nr:methyltransferase domain-containing protein [Tepidisphaeraceae bacterium]
MSMTQEDIRTHYEQEWKQKSDRANDTSQLAYSSPVEDAILYPTLIKLIGDLKLKAWGAVLDVGCGSGRWIRFYNEHYKPVSLTGIDFTAASVEMLKKWHGADSRLHFQQGDITKEAWDLQARFDLINIANVLFHIPEEDRFKNALTNLAKHLTEDGAIITTEYLPRITMRTQWMLVRSRYQFEQAVKAAGLKIVEIRASAFFSNDPMGIDGTEEGARKLFNQVRQRSSVLMQSSSNVNTKAFITQMLAEIEHATIEFCRERMAEVDMPSQKLVVLRRA